MERCSSGVQVARPAASLGVRAVLRQLVFYALVTPFWSLFDQKASTWVIQGRALALPGWGWFSACMDPEGNAFAGWVTDKDAR